MADCTAFTQIQPVTTWPDVLQFTSAGSCVV